MSYRKPHKHTTHRYLDYVYGNLNREGSHIYFKPYLKSHRYFLQSVKHSNRINGTRISVLLPPSFSDLTNTYYVGSNGGGMIIVTNMDMLLKALSIERVMYESNR